MAFFVGRLFIVLIVLGLLYSAYVIWNYKRYMSKQDDNKNTHKKDDHWSDF